MGENMKKLLALALGLMALALPSLALAETSFHIDFPAFVDSLQYMLKGMAGIYIVTAVIVVMMVLLVRLAADRGGKGDGENE